MRTKRHILASNGLILALLCATHGVWAQPPKVTATLIANVDTVMPGDAVKIGVLFDVPPKSHIYWRNPGDSGLPTTIEWSVPGDVSLGDLNWPTPKAFTVEGLNEIFYGYEDEVLLYFSLAIPSDATNTFPFKADVSWLLCLDDGVCIPDSAELELNLRVHSETIAAPTGKVFNHYAKTIPRTPEELKLELTTKWNETKSELSVALPESLRIVREHAGKEIAWYPDDGGAWTVAALDPRHLTVTPKFRDEPLVGGVLVLPIADNENNRRVYHVRLEGPKS